MSQHPRAVFLSYASEDADIYAQWGETGKALDWLETAYRLHDPGLAVMKNDELLEPLRREPRYQQVERNLNFPG